MVQFLLDRAHNPFMQADAFIHRGVLYLSVQSGIQLERKSFHGSAFHYFSYYHHFT